MADGIVEELFIAPAAGTGISEVWFRNYSVVANLGLRAAGTLIEDPESVAWGQTKDKFVVRTGTDPSNQKYYLFHIPRYISHIFPPLAIPAVILDRTHTPFTSTLNLISASATKTTINHTRAVVGKSVRGTRVLCGINCIENGISISIESQTDTSTTTPSSGSDSKTLGTLLSLATNNVQYGLNDAGDLVLLMTMNPGAALNVPVVPRDEQHLYVVRISGTTEEILFRTAVAAPSLTQTVHTTPTTPWTSAQEHATRPAGGEPPCLDPGADLLQPMNAGFTPPVDNVASTNGGTVQSGTSLLNNSLWDTTLPFVKETLFIATSTSTGLGTVIGGAAGERPSGGIPCSSVVISSNFTGDWIKQTWTLGNIWRYIVRRAYPLQLTSPINFLMVVERRHTGTGVRQHGLFLKTDVGFTTISPFTTNPAGFVTLNVMTANKYHALWYRQATITQVFLSSLRSGVSHLVGTNLAQLRAYRLRVIQGDLANPVDFLWQGKEEPAGPPAGLFLDGWETDGTPTLTDLPGFPLLVRLLAFGALAPLPPGITPPVLPEG